MGKFTKLLDLESKVLLQLIKDDDVKMSFINELHDEFKSNITFDKINSYDNHMNYVYSFFVDKNYFRYTLHYQLSIIAEDGIEIIENSYSIIDTKNHNKMLSFSSLNYGSYKELISNTFGALCDLIIHDIFDVDVC